jgi:hypothetical protein
VITEGEGEDELEEVVDFIKVVYAFAGVKFLVKREEHIFMIFALNWSEVFEFFKLDNNLINKDREDSIERGVIFGEESRVLINFMYIMCKNNI